MTLKFDEKLDRLAETEANDERIRYIENCFGNGGEKLVKAGRVLVGEGILMKMCRKKPKSRYFFLFNDMLVYGTSVIDKKKYINQHVISLTDMHIDSIPDGDDPKLRNGWIILSPKKSFSVYATTSKEKTEWMMHINNCIDKLSSSAADNRLKRLSSTQNAAPQWVPDSNADTCMRCRKSKFTVVNRRHHCRKCGFVICGDCSKNKFLLKSQSPEPVRVCDGCYSVLLTSGDEAISDTSGESDDDDVSSKSPGNTVQASREPRFYE